MNKVLVEVFVPSAAIAYDSYIPLDSTINEITALLSAAFMDLCSDTFVYDNDTVLCDAESGEILDINMSVRELNIRNGTRLILV